jgi:glutathione S-transferase
MKLIGSTTSPYVRKVRVVLAEKSWTTNSSKRTLGRGHAAAPDQPAGQGAALVMDGKEALFDSRVIVEYLDTLSPVGKLIPAGGRERAEVKTWEALADGVLDAGVAMRLEPPGPAAARPSAARPGWTARWARCSAA